MYGYLAYLLRNVHHMHTWWEGSQELGLQTVVNCCMCWELNLGPMEEQLVLLTAGYLCSPQS